MTTDSSSPTEPAISFARESLGPASERVVARASAQALILSRMRSGAALEDAVLAEVHREAAHDRRVADEFLAYFLADAQRRGKSFLAPALRRFLDTGDLVQSVLGDMWQDISRLHFETRGQFVSMLAQRLRWKALDHTRRMNAIRRSEGRRVSGPPEELDVEDGAPGPPSVVGSREETERLILALLRLPERDQALIRLHLRGEPLEVLSRETGLEPETARKALQRAIRRARTLS